MPPASAPSPSGARRPPCWARRWGENVQWGMKAWSRNRRRRDLPMPHWQVGTSWFREKLSPANRNKGYRGEQISRKNRLPWIECKELPRFRKKYRALGRHVCKIREIGGQKNGVQHATAIYPIPRYTRPRYIGLTLYCCSYVWFLFMDVYICVIYIYIFYCVSGHHGRTV